MENEEKKVPEEFLDETPKAYPRDNFNDRPVMISIRGSLGMAHYVQVWLGPRFHSPQLSKLENYVGQEHSKTATVLCCLLMFKHGNCFLQKKNQYNSVKLTESSRGMLPVTSMQFSGSVDNLNICNL